MTKKDLIPFKHVLVARNGNVYWFVGEEFDIAKQPEDRISYICLSSGINITNGEEYLKDNLLANREGYWERVYDEPRRYDIIYVYEVVDNLRWFDYIRQNEFIKGNLNTANDWSNTRIIKKIWERIDCEYECDL